MNHKKVIISIDPGSPKDRDKEATTGVFVGEYYKPKKLEVHSFKITAKNRNEDEDNVVKGIKAIIDKYKFDGYEIDVVLEQYINYAYNGAANNFQRNHTSELIGKIKYGIDNPVTEQATSQIKTKYSDVALGKLGILKKDGRNWLFTDDFGGGESNRHERDACRHYLLRRDKLGMYNYFDKVWDQF